MSLKRTLDAFTQSDKKRQRIVEGTTSNNSPQEDNKFSSTVSEENTDVGEVESKSSTSDVVQETKTSTDTTSSSIVSNVSSREQTETNSFFGLKMGNKIEVLWDIAENGTSVSKWWPCTFRGKSSSRSVTSDCLSDSASKRFEVAPQGKLSYVAFLQFPPCDTIASFIGDHVLVDSAADGEPLFWRTAGSEWQPSEMDRNALGDMTKEAVEVDGWGDPIAQPKASYDMTALLSDQIADRELGPGASVLELGMQELSRLPGYQQSSLALGFRSFADKVKELLRELQQTKGDGHVVTEDEIRNIISKVRRMEREKGN